MNGATFRETITSADGSTEAGSCTEAHALSLLRTALRRGYRIEATRDGGAVITREIPSSADTWQPPRRHTVTLEPATPAGSITPAMVRDLGMVANSRSPYLACNGPNAGRIVAAIRYAIPPATSARYMARGLVTAGEPVTERGQERRPAAISLTARLAMHARDHRATTSQPRGYVRPGNVPGLEGHIGPWRKGGCTYLRSSVARCPCGWHAPGEDRDDALRKALGHKQETAAAMVRELLSEPAAA